MNKVLIMVLACVALSCYKNKDDGYDTGNNTGGNNCGTHEGKLLYKDAQGCYYYTDNYNSTKAYVELSECKCE